MKKRLQHRCLPINIAKFLRIRIFKNMYERLSLYFRILNFFYFLFFLFIFLKNEKMANRKLGKVGNLGNLGEIIPSFLISEFSILPYSQNRKLGFEILGKKFPRFPRFPSFRHGLSLWWFVCVVQCRALKYFFSKDGVFQCSRGCTKKFVLVAKYGGHFL